MARSLSNAKLLCAFVKDQVSLVVIRRGYAVAAQHVPSGSSTMARGGIMEGKTLVEEPNTSSPWVPDPVTGYFKPENHINDVDVAYLRELLLKNKVVRHD